MAGSRRRLAVAFTFAGAFQLACCVAQTVLAVLLAAVRLDRPGSHTQQFFESLSQSVGFLGPLVGRWLRGDGPFANRSTYLLAWSLPAILATLAFLAALGFLIRWRSCIAPDLPGRLYRWAVAFAAVSVFAFPVVAPDFWLSPAWGWLAAHSQNPYYVTISPESVQGLPLEPWSLRMTCGPTWALISTAIMSLAGSHGLLAGLLFKAVLLGAWVATLRLVRNLAAAGGAWRESVAMLLLGWLPLGYTQALGEGHNDIVMMAAVLAWVECLRRDRTLAATAFLAAAVGVKYVAAPLFLLDFLYSSRARRQPLTAYFKNAAVAAAVLLPAFAVFYRSPAFFCEMASMRNWHFLEPAVAVAALGKLVHADLSLAGRAVRAMFPLVAGVAAFSYWKRPDNAGLLRAAFATMAAVLFSVVGHVFPWYLVWLLPLAALRPGTPLSTWTVAVALLAGWAYAVARFFPEANAFQRWHLTSLVMFALPTLFLVVQRAGARCLAAATSRRSQCLQ